MRRNKLDNDDVLIQVHRFALRSVLFGILFEISMMPVIVNNNVVQREMMSIFSPKNEPFFLIN